MVNFSLDASRPSSTPPAAASLTVSHIPMSLNSSPRYRMLKSPNYSAQYHILKSLNSSPQYHIPKSLNSSPRYHMPKSYDSCFCLSLPDRVQPPPNSLYSPVDEASSCVVSSTFAASSDATTSTATNHEMSDGRLNASSGRTPFYHNFPANVSSLGKGDIASASFRRRRTKGMLFVDTICQGSRLPPIIKTIQ